ncbi:Band 4.1-like protein 1, partial [Ophiophagus hannah]
MTTESGSDSESKDQDQEQKETSSEQEKATQEQQPQQVEEEHQNALKQFSSVAAHSTPVKKEQIVKKPKNMQCKVILLDGSEYGCEVEKRSKGQILFDKVCEHLNLLEKDYFGLTYRDMENQKNWLDPAKEIKKQIRNPAQLSEDITRYYLCLQLRDDIVSGRLPCSFVTLALLGSYTVQSELGDYDPDEYGSDYVSEFRFAPNHTKELEDKVIELHKSHRGMTPAEAEMHFLENAKKLSMYGDSEGVEIMLGVCASGLLIYRDRLRINRFAWPKFRYSGRTQAQTRRASALIDRPAPYFERSSSKRYTMSRSLDGASVNENHEMYMKDSMSAAEVGTGQYATTKGISQTNLITTVTPEKKAEEEKDDEQLKKKEEEGTPVSAIRHDTKQKARKGGTLFSFSLQLPESFPSLLDDDGYLSFPNLSETNILPQSVQHFLPIRSPSLVPCFLFIFFFLLSASFSVPYALTLSFPLAMCLCYLEPKAASLTASLENDLSDSSDEETDSERTDTAADGETTATEELDKTQEDLIKHQTNISELKRTFLETTTDASGTNEWEKRLSTSPVRLAARHEEAPMIEPLVPDETKEDKEKSEKRIFLQRESTAFLDSQRTETKTDEEKEAEEQQQEAIKKVVQETLIVKEKHVMSLHASEDAAKLAGLQLDATAQTISHVTSNLKGKEGSAVTEGAKEEKAAAQQEETATISHNLQEEQSKSAHILNMQESKPLFESSIAKTETDSLGSASPGGEKLEISMKEVPVVHTETKTITYESSEVDSGADSEPGVLMSAQTITSETTSTTTTTHITKTVKGGISETRIEKRIVITGDADIDHDQALAQAIKEAKEQHPDMSVTKVVD